MTRAARLPLAPGVAAIERQLRAIDRKAESLKGSGLGSDWLRQQGQRLHEQRERLQAEFTAQRLVEQGWTG